MDLSSFLSACLILKNFNFNRLIEFAANYFDLSSFADGETKQALQRAWNKRSGKLEARGDGSNEPDAKKRKKSHK